MLNKIIKTAEKSEKELTLYDKDKMRGRGRGKYMYKQELIEDGKKFLLGQMHQYFPENKIEYIM